MNRCRLFPGAMALLVACLLASVSSQAAVVYVNASSPAAVPNGASWDAAYRSVQNGIDAAIAGDEIWVAAGNYSANVTLRGGVGLYGGFAGTETDRSQRNRAANTVVLDGGQTGPIVTVLTGTPAEAVVDGFTIRNGSAPSSSSAGGVLCNGNARIGNNTLTGNTGMAVYCVPGAVVAIANNLITANTSSSGPVVSVYSNGCVVSGNVFSRNTSGTNCSILSIYQGTVVNNSFVMNIPGAASSDRSGVIGATYGFPVLANNIIAHNAGTAIAMDFPATAPVLLRNCLFANTRNYMGFSVPSTSDTNVFADPQVTFAPTGACHIAPGSPCRDAGDDASVVAGTTDIDGQARVQGAHVDIGADESDGTDWPAFAIRVTPSGDDTNDGLSWAAPKRTVRAAVSAAAAAGLEDVWVASGTYTGLVTMPPNVSLFGGFSGVETARSRRNAARNVTILDGNKAGTVVTIPKGSNGTLDGFTIRNGSTTSSFSGGGVTVSAASPIVSHNVFTGNTSPTGSGVFCFSSVEPLIFENVIAANTATSTSQSSFNAAALAVYSYGNAIFRGNLIHDNPGGSGIAVLFYSTAQIDRNTITGHTTTYAGGGVYATGGGYGPTRVSNNLVVGNKATYGGGIYASGDAKTVVVNNTVVSNSATTGGGIQVWNNPTVGNNIVAYNTTGIQATTTTTLKANLVFGNTQADYIGVADPTGTDGNLKADPMFVSLAYGNYHVQPASPAVGAGAGGWDAPGDTDIDGHSRVVGLIDIGADESDGTLWPVVPRIVRVRPDGDDAADGTTWATAKRTIAGGIAGLYESPAITGSEVWVAAGTYAERLTLRSSIHLFGGFRGDEVTRDTRDWRRNASILDGQGLGTVVTFLSATQGGIDGFTIRNGYDRYPNGSYSTAGGVYAKQSSVRIANVTATANTGRVISLDGGASSAIGNRVTGNAGVGIYLTGAGGRVANNVVTFNTDTGIYEYGNGVTIVNNTVAGNSGSGLMCAYTDGTTFIANNILAWNAAGLTGLSSNYQPTFEHNDVFGNSPDYSFTDLTGTDGNLKADPMFAGLAVGDVHIQPASPCRDAGESSAVLDGEVDMDGEPRVQNAGVDIGADESDGVSRTVSIPLVHVSSTGSDANDGATWATAKRTVNGALASLALGGEVWVAQGTYTEQLVLRPFTALYGGFAGDEATREQRDWAAHRTVLDGGGKGLIVSIPIAAPYATVDGFTLQYGAGYGGIRVEGPNARVTHNIIRDCTDADPATGGHISGGSAISIKRSPALIADNLITGNEFQYVGGIYVLGTCAPVITNNTIVANTSRSQLTGSAVNVESQSTPTIANNIIAFNTHGFYYQSNCTFTLRANCVYGNGRCDYAPPDAFGANGSIAVDPQLVDAANGGFTLRSTSPCIDAGDEAMNDPGIDRDLLAATRLRGNHIDIGAFETAGTRVPTGAVLMRVSPAGDDANDGSSWSKAKRTITAALNATLSPGGEIWVAAGTYSERLILRDGVGLYGGFAGTETGRDQRDWVRSATVVSGGAGCVVTTGLWAGAATVLDGFTVRDGNAGGTASALGNTAGGLQCDMSSPTIRNNTFVNDHGPTLYSNGGSPHIEGNSIAGVPACVSCVGGSPVVLNNTLRAGGVVCAGGSPTISHNYIEGSSNNPLGGVVCTDASSTISNNTLIANVSPLGGGIWIKGGSAVIRDNLIAGNYATPNKSTANTGYGSGLALVNTNATVVNNTVACNRGLGGAVFASGSTVTLTNNVVAFNSRGIERLTGDASTLAMKSNAVFGNGGADFAGVPDPTGMDGNISADPMFSDYSAANFHLRPTSPCCDAGDNATLQAGEVDIDGRSRRLNARVDIGAYESDGTLDTTGPRIIRMSPTGNDANDGSSWAKAVKTPYGAEAVTAISREVWVAAGTYDRAWLQLPSFMHLYCGFAGTETSRAGRTGAAGPTVITGDVNHFGMTTATGAVQVSVDGLTVSGSAWGIRVGSYTDAQITNCSLTSNQLGLICYDGSDVVVTGTRIQNNRRMSPSLGTYAGGVYVSPSAKVALRNCEISGNSQETGGAVFADRATVTLVGDTIVGNTATTNAGGVYGSGSTISATNCIVAFNGSGFSADPANPGSFALAHNDVYGNAENFENVTAPGPASGNVAVDPLFIDRTSGDYHLLPGSPCIDSGQDAAVLPEERDIDGSPRILGSHVDIGAHEFLTAGYYTLADASTALRIAGGLDATDWPGLLRLNVDLNASSARVVDIVDAILLARKASGLDANP